MNKPNHICKNPNCKREYYFCEGCNLNKNIIWGVVGCCPECAQIYWDLVEKARNKQTLEVSVQIESETQTESNSSIEEISIKTRKPRAKKETTETPVDDVDSEE